ncbi:RNA-binding protein [Mariprofundus micogutta]|uniref:RNA-binding protein n=1 Tax=Mariprofundus micogutta TaxID=1921010 RepID=A0A1L8CM84_9PROT|nr:ribosome assembly RNA-binding protein YhbY [Mariprofundus micogutta]GAV20023.1 RNA-binding protein [Mariprofundus micogutta]
MPLSNKQIKALKSKAHHLKPVVRIGQKGITENVMMEINNALDIHELIKVHIADDDRESRQQSGSDLAAQSGAELVSQIGKTCILYRQKPADS